MEGLRGGAYYTDFDGFKSKVVEEILAANAFMLAPTDKKEARQIVTIPCRLKIRGRIRGRQSSTLLHMFELIGRWKNVGNEPKTALLFSRNEAKKDESSSPRFRHLSMHLKCSLCEQLDGKVYAGGMGIFTEVLQPRPAKVGIKL